LQSASRVKTVMTMLSFEEKFLAAAVTRDAAAVPGCGFDLGRL